MMVLVPLLCTTATLLCNTVSKYKLARENGKKTPKEEQIAPPLLATHRQTSGYVHGTRKL